MEIGKRVQAIDEIGRWEEGRIMTKDGDLYTVGFTGWDESYNRVVSLARGEIRERLGCLVT